MNIMYKIASVVASLRNTHTFPKIEQNTAFLIVPFIILLQ